MSRCIPIRRQLPCVFVCFQAPLSLNAACKLFGHVSVLKLHSQSQVCCQCPGQHGSALRSALSQGERQPRLAGRAAAGGGGFARGKGCHVTSLAVGVQAMRAAARLVAMMGCQIPGVKHSEFLALFGLAFTGRHYVLNIQKRAVVPHTWTPGTRLLLCTIGQAKASITRRAGLARMGWQAQRTTAPIRPQRCSQGAGSRQHRDPTQRQQRWHTNERGLARAKVVRTTPQCPRPADRAQHPNHWCQQPSERKGLRWRSQPKAQPGTPPASCRLACPGTS